MWILGKFTWFFLSVPFPRFELFHTETNLKLPKYNKVHQHKLFQELRVSLTREMEELCHAEIVIIQEMIRQYLVSMDRNILIVLQ